MGASGVIGFLIGFLLAGLVAFALARTLLRVTNSPSPKALFRFIWAGLLPGTRHDGIAVQRALAKLLKESYSVMASGRRVAAAAVDIHVSPEDYRLISSSIGTAAAVADLTDFYVSYARDNQWHIVAEPVVQLKRDISLRARQAYAQRTLHPPEPDDPVTEDLDRGVLREAEQRARVLPSGPHRAVPPEGATEVLPETARAAMPEDVTDVLPSRSPRIQGSENLTEVLDAGGPADGMTRPYETAAGGMRDGDLVVVHGTDVRMVPREKGRATIGRASHSDLVIDRPGVSRDHALVELREDGWWVVPREAKNGTLLDGRPLNGPSRLPPESTLGLGARVKLKLTVEPLQP